jgi:hypothetical protein
MRKIRDRCSFALGIATSLTTREVYTMAISSVVEHALDNCIIVLGL